MKTWKTVRICPIDTVLFRDGRPFGTELGAQTAYSLPMPTPSTLAGFLRTLVGNLKQKNWNESIERYSEESIRGPLMRCDNEFMLPAPADAVVFEEGRVAALRPYDLPDNWGCNLPSYDCGLKPLRMLGDQYDKPASGYDFWGWNILQRWLLEEPVCQLPERITAPPSERRVHVGIKDDTLASEESLLYTVEYRSYEVRANIDDIHSIRRWSIVAQVHTDLVSVAGVGGLGGERRLATVEPFDEWLTCPEEVKHRMQGARSVRMYLATPAVFTCGWRPAWLKKEQRNGECALCGSPPGVPDVELQLVAAAVPRRQAISGWSLRNGGGPKPMRWCVPAGAVYFFKVTRGDAAQLIEKCWLESVSDGKEQNGRPINGDRAREAGFGLALWGVWNSNEGGAR